MTKRTLHICKHPGEQSLYASDFQGRVYKLNSCLEIIAQSDPLPGRINSLYAIACNQDYVFGRDLQGNLVQFDGDSLAICNIAFLNNFCDLEKRQSFTPIPTVSHGLFTWNGRVLVNSPYGELLQFDANTLNYLKTTELDAEAFVESFDGSLDQHVISDCAGNVWYGHLDDRPFEKKMRLDYGPIHCLRYDRRHHRYWMTTDNHGGFSIVDTTGENIHRITITNDDCEWLDFDADSSRAYLACFDHRLYVFDNEPELPQLIQKIGPFKFQLKQVLYLDHEHIYVLLESGELYCVNRHGKVTDQAPFGSNCIWDIVQDPRQSNRIFCPMEDGGMVHIEYDANADGDYRLNLINHFPSFGFGRMRRVKPLGDGNFIAGCSDGTLFRFDRQGGIDWIYKSRSIVRDVAVSSDESSMIAVNEAGDLIQLDVESGKLVWQEQFDQPLWAATWYDNDMIVSERCMSPEDQGQTASIPTAHLYQIDGNKKEVKLSIKVSGNIKRIKVLDNGHLLLNGNGNIAAVEYDLDARKAVQSWSEWQLNTCEDAVKFGGNVHTVTYGYQLNTYRESGEMLDCQFSPDNYPKAVYCSQTQSGIPVLMVAGRGPYVSLYHLRNGIPDVARTLYVQEGFIHSEPALPTEPFSQD